MKVLRNIKIKGFKTAVAIGYFDGVHIGHKKVIKKVVNSEFLPVVLTFDYENNIPKSKGDIKFITTNNVKFGLFKELGVKIVVVPYFENVKNIGFIDFFEKILVKDLNAKILVCGKNLRFGKNRIGDVNSLKFLASLKKIYVYDIDLVKIKDEYVSSTRIRDVMKKGNLKLLKQLLGYSYYIKISLSKCFCLKGFIYYKVSKNMAFLRDGCYLIIIKKNYFFCKTVANIREYDEYFMLKLYCKDIIFKDFRNETIKVIFIDNIKFY